MTGAFLEVYSGTEVIGDNLLWTCNNCAVVPKPIISDKGGMVLRFRTWPSGYPKGDGFRAVYWNMNDTAGHQVYDYNHGNGTVLEMPPGYTLQGTENNMTSAWVLGLDSSVSTVRFHPRLKSNVTTDIAQMDSLSRDGRQQGLVADYQSFAGKSSLTCGMVLGNSTYVLVDPSSNGMSQKATQKAGAYMESVAAGKQVYNTYGIWDNSQPDSALSEFQPAPTCKYLINTGSEQSILIYITRLEGLVKGLVNSRLRIWGGKWGNDALIYDSDIAFAYPQKKWGGYMAPCGKATILLEVNKTLSNSVDHGLEFSYMASESDGDSGADCHAYYLSLLPEKVFVDPYLAYYYTFASCGIMCCLFFGGLYLRKLSKKYYPENGCNPFKRIKIYKIVTPRHLSYTPKWDTFRNRFLPSGECNICMDKCAVFRLSPCNHKLCVEDMCNYLSAALGDISLFPIKCPMHYEGCTTTIDAKIAKRVLNQLEFDKFNEFMDRSLYGEGMRCIFCNNYVNFPEEGGFSMVECPYCVQTFCIRCKKPRHFGAKCPLDGIDDSLDSWKQMSGAQKCPACSKLIEKTDKESCNHMVHKITDGIPCVKDRTDFCYCCGAEVLDGYPHDEVKNPGVNHFPDGVYQKCRHQQGEERDAERERLKKLRRTKNGGGATNAPPVKRERSFMLGGVEEEAVVHDEEGWEMIPAHLLGNGDSSPGGSPKSLGDRFDQQWDDEMSKAQATAELENPQTPPGSAGATETKTGTGSTGSVSPTTPVRGTPVQRRVPTVSPAQQRRQMANSRLPPNNSSHSRSQDALNSGHSSPVGGVNRPKPGGGRGGARGTPSPNAGRASSRVSPASGAGRPR